MTMLLRYSLSLLLSLPAVAMAQPRLPTLDGLQGCWEYATQEQQYREVWLPPSDNVMLGTSLRLNGSRTETYEFMRIVATDTGTVLLIQPEGEPAARYVLESTAPLQFRRDGPGEPQRIRYQWPAAGRLQINLDALTFVLTQKDCDS